VSEDGELAGYLRLGLYPNLGVSWWTVMIVTPGQPLVAWTDYELPVPGEGALRLRARGVELVCDTTKPLEELTVRGSGIGAVHGRPEAIYEGRTGQPIALSIDLTWRTGRLAVPLRADHPIRSAVHVAGQLRLGDQEIAVAGHRPA